MKDIILKWWNRKWGDWEYKNKFYTYDSHYDKSNEFPTNVYKIFISKSNDGLERTKRVKI